MPILQYRFGRGIQKLRLLVDAGITGRPYVANVDVAWRRGADYYAVPWRGTWEGELGGVLTSHALHALDMTMFILGQPVAVWARTTTLVNDVETEDCAAITLRWADGSLATRVGDPRLGPGDLTTPLHVRAPLRRERHRALRATAATRGP